MRPLQQVRGKGTLLSTVKDILSLVVSVAANLSLAAVFGRALLSPEAHVDFIFRTGMLVFLIEFLSVHSGFLFIGLTGEGGAKSLGIKISLLAVYAIFAFGFGILSKNIYVPVIFLLGLTAKFFAQKATHDPILPILSIPLLILSVIVVVFALPERLETLFPFPEAVMAQKPAGSGGEFVDRPQTLLAWGALYYPVVAIISVIVFLFSRRSE